MLETKDTGVKFSENEMEDPMEESISLQLLKSMF